MTQACGLLKGELFTPIGADRFAVKLAGSALHPQDTARKRQEGARRGRSRENRAHFCPDKEGAQTIPVYCRAPDAVRAESRRLSPLIAVSLPYFPLTHINASLTTCLCWEGLRGKAAPPADTAGAQNFVLLRGVFGVDRFARREAAVSPLVDG